MYDFAIIGKGMIGAAAARYAAAQNGNVLLIGPDEPADWSTHEGAYASHYDQGRITRRIDNRIVWGELAARSISQYRQLEQASGIPFYVESGGVTVGPEDDYMRLSITNGRKLGATFERHTGRSLKRALPFFDFPDEYVITYEQGGAGYVNPRALVAAQIAVARASGLTEVTQEVARIEPAADNVHIHAKDGSQFTAKRVLVAAGAYTSWLLPQPIDLFLKPRTILMARIDEAEAERLKRMTSIIYYDGYPNKELDGIYVLPPMQFPDGHTYIKLGGMMANIKPATSAAYLTDWFQKGGNPREVELLEDALRTLVPNINIEAIVQKPCVTTYTPHGHPYVDSVIDGQLYVATGGNGAAAKSSDAIGALAANLMINNQWTDSLNEADFKLAYL